MPDPSQADGTLPRSTAPLLPPSQTNPKGAVTCGICGMPGHRFGLGDPHHKYDAMACVNMLLPELDRLRAALREAARYEQVAWYSDKDMWVWRYPDQAIAPGGHPDVVPLYRRVTTAGEES